MTLVFLTSCFSLGAYVAQNSTKLMPRVLGHILMFMSGDGIMNSVVILVFMHILNVDDRITNGYMDHLRRSALVKLAKIFAIPIATLLWSLFLCVTSVISYITQPDAPELQTPTYERRSHHHETQEHVPDGPQDSDQTPLPTIVQKSPMPQAVVIALGNFAALLLLRFIWVIHAPANVTNRRDSAIAIEDTHTEVELFAIPRNSLDSTCNSSGVVASISRASTFSNGSVTSEPEQFSNSDRERSASPILTKRSKQARRANGSASTSRSMLRTVEESRSLSGGSTSEAQPVAGVFSNSRGSSGSSTWSASSIISV
ncbi:hypothetical protein BDY19DRAFT_992183 [Irpex rosettiformis]|uniref:Uncharacterized protein n=1 Tax=Irpex rosettiformis TaxID=378272 RepID=A0ACB8U950_9APHY|nr:hypothetical protein BDY19DRAFT_992183 [Irpex rosettiformis]